MKKILAILVALVCLTATTAALANETITIGATATPHAAVLEFIKEDLAALGYDLDIVYVTDYFISNPATTSGDMDANYFQHLPFLIDYNNSVDNEADKLVAAVPVHCEPYGIYPGSKATLDQITKGDKIAVTNDPSNETRALLLLQDAGLIKLAEDATYLSSLTKESIVENPYELDIYEVNAELIPGILEDVAFAVINGNYVIEAGMTVKDDALYTEAEGVTGQVYINYVVCRAENVDAPWLKALETVLHTDKVRDFILNNVDFAGGVVPVFEVVAE